MVETEPCPLLFLRVYFSRLPLETSWERREWAEVMVQCEYMWTSRPAVMVAAKPIIYWAQGAMAALTAAADFRRHSQCAVIQSTTSQLTSLTGCFMSNSPPGKGRTLRGISHVAHIPKLPHRGWQQGWDEGSVGMKGKDGRQKETWVYLLFVKR